MNSVEMDLKYLAELIRDIKFTMMTTVERDGSMHSRPMVTQKIDPVSFDGRLWFFTKKDTAKVHSIEQDQHINLAYASPDHNHYVSISGRAELSEDKDKIKELWNPMLKAWFPMGVDDPEISLISVVVEKAEIWDAPPSKMIQMVGFVKSIVTGKPIDQNLSSERLDLTDRH